MPLHVVTCIKASSVRIYIKYDGGSVARTRDRFVPQGW